MAKIYRETRTVTWETAKWLPATPEAPAQKLISSRGSVPVEIEIDLDALFRTLGQKAARAKGKRAVLGGGMIIARRRA